MGDVVRGPFPRKEDRIAFVDPGPLGAVEPAAGLVPPQNLDAEAAVLSAVLVDADHRPDAPGVVLAAVRKALSAGDDVGARAALAVVPAASRTVLDEALEVLKPEHFFSEANGRIWQVAQLLTAEKTPVDLVTVAERLRALGWLAKVGGTAYLAQVADATPAPGNVRAHCEIVRELWVDRMIIATCQRAYVDGYRPEDRDAWRASVRAEIGRLTAPRVRLAGVPIGVAVQESRAQLEAQRPGKLLGVSWGLEVLDRTFGPIARKEQHIIAGLSEHGKTSLAAHVMWSVASTPLDDLGVGEAVYFVLGETQRGPFVFRVACTLAGVDTSVVKGGRAEAHEMERVGQWLGWLKKLPIVIDDEPADAVTLAGRIREHQRLFASGHARDADGVLLPKCRLSTVIGDHAQVFARVCSGLDARADMKSRIAAVSFGWLNHIAKALDVGTVLLAQVRRDVIDAAEARSRQKGRVFLPRAAHIEGAAELQQDADTIAIVHRPELPLLESGEDVPAKWNGVAAIVPAKRRWGGAKGLVRLGYDLGRFSEDLPAAARGEAFYQ